MKIQCQSFEEFVECLSTTDLNAETLYANTLRVSISRQETCVTVQLVTFMASTIVDATDTQYILEVNVNCGFNRLDSPPDMSGQKKADKMIAVLRDLAALRGWTIRPGVISE